MMLSERSEFISFPGCFFYFIFSHFRNKSRFAFSSVTAITSSPLIPFSSAIIAATYLSLIHI